MDNRTWSSLLLSLYSLDLSVLSRHRLPSGDNEFFSPEAVRAQRLPQALARGEKWSVETRIDQVWGKHAPLGKKIALAESGMRCGAIGDGHLTFQKNGEHYGKSYGPFQIRSLPGRPSPVELLDCSFNIQYAYEIYKKQGHSPWSVCIKKIKC